MSRAVPISIAIIIGFAVRTCIAQAGKYEKLEAEVRPKVQALWLEAAKQAIDKKATAVAQRAVDRAIVFGSKAPEIVELQGALDPMGSDPPESKLTETDEGSALEKDALAKAAALLDPLAAIEPSEGARARAVDDLTGVLEADPKNAKRTVLWQKRGSAAASKKDWTVAGPIVARAAELDPDGYKAGKYTAAEQALMKSDRLLVRGRGHLLEALVMLPGDWSAKKKWPIVVAIAGAGCDYEACFGDLAKKAGKRPYILVFPKTLGNANEFKDVSFPYPAGVTTPLADLSKRPERVLWDTAGIEAALAEVRARWNGEEKISMTGYSGGGFVVEHWLWHRRAQLAAVCLSSANYWDWPERNAPKVDEGGVPVLLVTGSQDSAGQERIFPQNDEALKKLTDAGFKDVKRNHLPGRSHEAFYEFAFEHFDKVRAAAAKAGK